MREDSKEQIMGCLSCTKEDCTNCLTYKKKRKTGTRVVIAFREGEEDMLFDDVTDAADFFTVHKEAIRQALYKGGRCQGYYWRFA